MKTRLSGESGAIERALIRVPTSSVALRRCPNGLRGSNEGPKVGGVHGHKFALRPGLELSRFQVNGASSRVCAPRDDGESGADASRLVVTSGSKEVVDPRGSWSPQIRGKVPVEANRQVVDEFSARTGGNTTVRKPL